MEFISRESSRFVGRGDFIQEIVNYVSSDADAPLVISGGCGSGKTALAARLDYVLGNLSTEPTDSCGVTRQSLDVTLKDSSNSISDDEEIVESRVSEGLSLADNDESLSIQTDNEVAALKSLSSLHSGQHFRSNDRHESHRQSQTRNLSYRHSLISPRCLTLINGLVSSALNSFDDLSRRILSFLRFPFDERVASVCRNWTTLAREALSADYNDSRVIILDGIKFLRGETFSVATKLSWLPLKLGKNVCVILTLSTEGQCKEFLDELNSREQKPKVMDLPPFRPYETRAFLSDNLPKDRDLGPDLIDVVLAKSGSGNPLWLYLLCLELSHISNGSPIGAYLEKIEENLEERIGQILFKFPFVKSVDLRCRKVDCDNMKDLVIGALCLLCLADNGLTEAELGELLSDKDHLLPPTEHVEKGESERSEKSSRLIPKSLSTQVWDKVINLILPILHPAIFLHRSPSLCDDNREGGGGVVGGVRTKIEGMDVLRFHHSAIQNAVGRIYFNAEKDDVFDELKSGASEFYRHKIWWHTKLAKFFARIPDARRKAEEYPRHLKALGDADGMTEYLTDWCNFDVFFSEPTLNSEILLKYWEAAGGTDVMIERYGLNLKICEDLVKDDNVASCTNSPRPSSPNFRLYNDSKSLDNERDTNIDDLGNESISINDNDGFCDNSFNENLTNERESNEQSVIYGTLPTSTISNSINNNSTPAANAKNNNNNSVDIFPVSNSSFKASGRDGILQKYEKVAELLMTAGSYMTAIEMTWHAIDVEKRELGARPSRLASLYDLTSKGYTEIVKMYDFASDEQLPHIQKAIKNGRKAIEIRKQVIAEKEGDKNGAAGGGGGRRRVVRRDDSERDSTEKEVEVEGGRGVEGGECEVSVGLIGGSGDIGNDDEKNCEETILVHDDGSGDSGLSPSTEKASSEDSKDESVHSSDDEVSGRGKTSQKLEVEDMDLIHQRHRLGLSLMNLAFNLDSWDACGGNNELSGSDARKEGLEQIDNAIEIFVNFKDDARLAEALMTKGILSPRGSSKQQKLYNRVMELAKLTFGKYHALTCRLYINIGILHEDNQDYKKAFEYFKDWSDICENVYGKKHPKTVRAYRVLKEPRYQRMAALESGVGGFVNRVLRSATEAFNGGDSDSNRFMEQCHEIAEAEYGDQEEEEDGPNLDDEVEGSVDVGSTCREEVDAVDDDDDDEDEEEEICEGELSRYDNVETDEYDASDGIDDLVRRFNAIRDGDSGEIEDSDSDGSGATLSGIDEDSASRTTRSSEEEDAEFLTRAVQDLIERGFTSLDDESDDGLIYE